MASDPQYSDNDDKFNEALPLPEEVKINHDDDLPPERQAAAELIRQRVESAYTHQPDAETEALEAADPPVGGGPTEKLSSHQQFIYDLATSGQPTRNINAAWHEYYAGMTDNQKHQVWQEFNQAHAQASRLLKAVNTSPEATEKNITKKPAHRAKRQPTAIEKTVAKHGKKLAAKAVSKIPEKHRRPLKSLAFGLAIGSLVVLIFLFTFFNERFIAPFIQPSRNVSNTQVITANAPVSTKPEIIIPKINVEIPVIYWVKSTDEKAVQDGLDNGVVHYADTAIPGQDGNVVIVGHSASNIFNNGRYKFAFSLLRRVDIGDSFYLQKDGVRYTYQVYKIRVVAPTNVSVLGPDQDQPAVATLITCDPPGTSSNRLIVVGRQVSPNPQRNHTATTKNKVALTKTRVLPSNSPSLWSRFVHWFTQ